MEGVPGQSPALQRAAGARQYKGRNSYMDINSIEIQALITFITPYLIQLAKRSQSAGLAWIDQNKPKICVFPSAVAALATAMGIEFVHSPHSFTVSWPGGATLGRGLAAFLVSAVLQFAAQ